MKWLKLLLLLALTISALLAGILITIYNPEVIQLKFWVWQAPAGRLGSLIVMVFGLGCVLGICLNTLIMWRLRASRRRLQGELDATNKRLEQIQ